MKNKKQILVTGCSGLVGTHLVHKLLDKGYSVVGIDLVKSPSLPDHDNFTFDFMDLRSCLSMCIAAVFLYVVVALSFGYFSE